MRFLGKSSINIGNTESRIRTYISVLRSRRFGLTEYYVLRRCFRSESTANGRKKPRILLTSSPNKLNSVLYAGQLWVYMYIGTGNS